ncbi:hypothetical protein NDU88_005209 [Pleurodeles waltl]|uniref:Uncharacterized protein n=1 Tax=Pleurodeles waltl TaxID=8319 RepID=A0AAV7L029_PLEWA|nr:hypothetical protein NDU88_005209 [Pleurodeles waltl]
MEGRVADLPATCSIGSRSERHPWDNIRSPLTDIGNPDIRIPGNLPMKDDPEEQRGEEAEAAGVGNPDIWVPESYKSEKGLRTRCAAEGKDTETKDTENTDRGDSRENARRLESYHEERGTPTLRDNSTEEQRGPNKPELRNVPGGTYLKQVRSCLREKLRSMVGREEGGEGE